ncbi:hypothetical protein PHMEG_00015531 [Phytophthora megakarya]|uniref:Reverse transcriptase domain-containing protein n=1 Tax=Phytophthora megakarya TaxID=4795 RepID=A0A225W1J5_9STRA|nr:hypothetical protein PHMEG_00015531 [Phytophthora megakarya]
MSMSGSNVTAWVVDYFKRFQMIVADNGLTECFSHERGAQQKCKRLILSLKPPALNQEVKQRIRNIHADAKKNSKALFTLVVEKATELERQFIRLKLQKQEASGREEKPKVKLFVEKVDSKPTTKPDAKPKPANLPIPPPGPCPKCSELHWLRECPSATEAEKVELLKRFRNARTTKKAKLKRLDDLLQTTDCAVMLNGVLELPCHPDSGSDFTAIGRSHWDQLTSWIRRVTLGTSALRYRTKRLVTATLKAKWQVQIHTAAGPVEPMELVDVLVVDVDDGELLVGNNLLTTLGIDVDRRLEQLACRDDAGPAGDPIQLDDDMPVHVGEPFSINGDHDIFFAVEQLIDRAVDCRLPQVENYVHASDIWRLDLRADPPANVPLLEVQLREGNRPAKCKPTKNPHTYTSSYNTKSQWSISVLLVKKSAELMDLRKTVDYRTMNALTDIMVAVMPIISLVSENAHGMNHFDIFDFINCFRQLPLDELCQELFSYMTDEKIFNPRRVPQGCADAAINFQKTMEARFTSLLYQHLLIWIDYLSLYAEDIETYLEKLDEPFSLLFLLMDHFGLNISAKK